MIEGNALKIENHVEVNNQNDLTGIKADCNPLIETTNNGLLYLGDKLGKPLVGAIECLFWAKIIEKCHTEPYFSMMSELKLLPFLKNDFAPKFFAIPEEHRIPPNMRIAKGVFENVIDLAAHQTTLQEMFANLLAGSMDNRKSEGVHPSYAKLISELSEEDAKFLMLLFEQKRIPSLFIREYFDEEGYQALYNKNVTENYSKDIYILEAKGLLNRKGGLFSSDPNKEGQLKSNKFTERFEKLKKDTNIVDDHGLTLNLLALTPFGEAFMEAVTLKESPTDEES
jgi:hypothetical protein